MLTSAPLYVRTTNTNDIIFSNVLYISGRNFSVAITIMTFIFISGYVAIPYTLSRISSD